MGGGSERREGRTCSRKLGQDENAVIVPLAGDVLVGDLSNKPDVSTKATDGRGEQSTHKVHAVAS